MLEYKGSVQQKRVADVDRAGQLTGLKQSPDHTSYWLPVTSWFYPHFLPPLYRMGGEFSTSSACSFSTQIRAISLLCFSLAHTNTQLHLPLLRTSTAHMATLDEAKREKRGEKKEARKRKSTLTGVRACCLILRVLRLHTVCVTQDMHTDLETMSFLAPPLTHHT